MSNIGFRQFTSFTRPAVETIALLKGLPTPNICDNMSRIYSINGLKPFNDSLLLGPAFTVKVPAGDNIMFNMSIDLAEPGDILVVDAGGMTERALCGEIMVSHARYRKLGGFVINGCVRDAAALKKMDFPIYALGTSPNGPYKNGPGEIGVPVVAGGMAVLPGDVLVGDKDGLVVIRQDDIEDVAKKARKQMEEEQQLLVKINNGEWDRSGFPKILAEKGCEIVV